jgi:iron(III) transport system permease protein
VAGVLASLFTQNSAVWTHLTSTILPDLVFSSLVLMVLVALGVMVIGTLTAWLTAHFEFRGRASLEWGLILPLAMPAYVMAYAYTDALQYAGPLQSWLREAFHWQSRTDYWFPDIRTLPGCAVMMMFVLYPYVYLLARLAFLEQSRSLSEAGSSFGYSRTQLFLKVSLPLARPAIAAGTALAVMETLADYGTVSYFGFQTFTTGIFNAWFSLGDRGAAAKLSAILLGFVAVVMLLESISRRQPRYFQSTALGVMLACALPLAVGFIVPILLLLRLALQDDNLTGLFSARFAQLLFNSASLAAITASCGVAIAVWLAYEARSNRGGNRSGHPTFNSAINRVIGMGYAVPGTIIAVGVMIPVIALDHLLVDALNAWFGGWLNAKLGLILTGSMATLVYAYLIRFLAVGLHGVEAGLTKITPAMDDAARSLGATRTTVLTQIHVPLLRKSLVTAALLIFVDVMKELPATLVLRPFNFDTLAVQVYVLAKDERLAEAAWPAIAMVLVGLIPVLLVSRQMRGAASVSRLA